jgi:hypothetical protein
VRQAELELARARAVYGEQEDLIMLEVSDAVAESTRAHAAVKANFERLTAAQQDRLSTKTAYDADQVTVDLLLESQQRLAEAQRQYFRSLANYSLSLMTVHVSKGTLLAYDSIFLSEGAWPRKAYRDAAEVGRRWKPKRCSCTTLKPGVLSKGHFEATLSSDSCATDHFEPTPIEVQPQTELLPAPPDQ